jgi:hypothetical protein
MHRDLKLQDELKGRIAWTRQQLIIASKWFVHFRDDRSKSFGREYALITSSFLDLRLFALMIV